MAEPATRRPQKHPVIHRAELAFSEALAFVAEHAAAHLTDMLFAKGDPIKDAMLYAAIGGKSLRGFLVWETGRLHQVPADACRDAACAIEALHAFSLVHDDLPCMDDDDLRRGQPTVHRKWDEATAVLAGDALQSLAFQFLGEMSGVSDRSKIDLMTTLAIASGMDGMVGGQALDIAAESAADPLNLEEISRLQAGKTGALLTWSCMAGPRMAEADPSALKVYGDAIGLAFQIADDILDVEGDAEEVGKAVGKDDAAGKATFVSLLGRDGAKRRAKDLVSDACDALSVYGDDAETLREAARFVISRTH